MEASAPVFFEYTCAAVRKARIKVIEASVERKVCPIFRKPCLCAVFSVEDVGFERYEVSEAQPDRQRREVVFKIRVLAGEKPAYVIV